MNIIYIALIATFQILLFFCLGLLTFRAFHINVVSFSLTILFGFVFYFCIFGFFAIPMILTSQKLSALSCTMGIVSVVILVCTMFFCRKQFYSLVQQVPTIIKEHSYMLIPLGIAFLLLQLIVFTHVDSSADGSYYIGKVSTDVYTNTMGHYDPYTGAVLSELDGRRVFACFPEYNAVISCLFHIHPLNQAKLIMPQFLAFCTLLIYYQIGLSFFKANKKKADAFVCVVFALDLYSYTIYTNSTFLFTRTYEGKSILANIIIPGILLCFYMLWNHSSQKLSKMFLVLLSVSSCIFSSSSMLIVPVSLTIGAIIWIYSERTLKSIVFYVVCLLPNLVICLLYLLFSKGILIYPI